MNPGKPVVSIIGFLVLSLSCPGPGRAGEYPVIKVYGRHKV